MEVGLILSKNRPDNKAKVKISKKDGKLNWPRLDKTSRSATATADPAATYLKVPLGSLFKAEIRALIRKYTDMLRPKVGTKVKIKATSLGEKFSIKIILRIKKAVDSNKYFLFINLKSCINYYDTTFREAWVINPL